MSNRSTDAIDESIGTEASPVIPGSIVPAEGINLGTTTLAVPAEEIGVDRSGRVQDCDVGREASPADSAGEVGDDGIVSLDSQHPPDESAADISWSTDRFLPPAEPAPKTQARYRLQLNAEQRRQLEGLDLSRPVPVPGRRDLTRRVISIVLVVNELASRGIPVCAATVRAGLVALGWCTEDKGNQALGDVLGRWGLDLSHRKQKVSLGGELRTVTVYDVPAGGVFRADLEAKFSIPRGWDWAQYTLADDGGHDQGKNPPLAATEPEVEDECTRLLREPNQDGEPCPELQ